MRIVALWLHAHCVPTGIVAACTLYLWLQVDPLAPRPSARELLETYKALQAAEKEVLQHVRDSEWEGREIGRTRNNQEQSITLEAPYYDICRIQVSAGRVEMVVLC
jgi:hypothetical protein